MADTLTLTYLSGSLKGESVSFECVSHTDITIGRDKKNQIVFDGQDNKSVSRKHAYIKYTDNLTGGFGDLPGWFIVDHSTNGTYVNGNKLLDDELDLNDGDVISFTKDRRDIRIKIKSLFIRNTCRFLSTNLFLLQRQ